MFLKLLSYLPLWLVRYIYKQATYSNLKYCAMLLYQHLLIVSSPMLIFYNIKHNTLLYCSQMKTHPNSYHNILAIYCNCFGSISSSNGLKTGPQSVMCIMIHTFLGKTLPDTLIQYWFYTNTNSEPVQLVLNKSS